MSLTIQSIQSHAGAVQAAANLVASLSQEQIQKMLLNESSCHESILVLQKTVADSLQKEIAELSQKVANLAMFKLIAAASANKAVAKPILAPQAGIVYEYSMLQNRFEEILKKTTGANGAAVPVTVSRFDDDALKFSHNNNHAIVDFTIHGDKLVLGPSFIERENKVRSFRDEMDNSAYITFLCKVLVMRLSGVNLSQSWLPYDNTHNAVFHANGREYMLIEKKNFVSCV